MSEEHLGQAQLALVGSNLASQISLRDFALCKLNAATIGLASASLLRNDWAITAAHNVEIQGADGQAIPDPSRPGQFQVVDPSMVSITAAWDTDQVRQAVQIETFRPFDIAIIRVNSPFKIDDYTTGYSRLLNHGQMFPYWGEEVPVQMVMFGCGISQFATQAENGTFLPSVNDKEFRVGWAMTRCREENLYWYPSEGGQMIAGGDSGGPSFCFTGNGYVLMGVHALTSADCLAGAPAAPTGQVCGDWRGPGPVPAGYSSWRWVAATRESADAPVLPVREQIMSIMGPAPEIIEPVRVPPPPNFIGTFGTTPPGFQPIWLYAIQDDGVLFWYRKDAGDAPWQGPTAVGTGWAGFRDVISGGGNSIHALNAEGKLLWYQHDGFNDGSLAWKGPVEVAAGWNFRRIFSGGEGIIYAIRDDGALLWFQHGAYLNGGAASTLAGPKQIGTGWSDFSNVFSSGKGIIYAMKANGALQRYQHDGYATGEPTWGFMEGPSPRQSRPAGTGWDEFRQIIPVGDAVILAVQNDGTMLRYKDLGMEHTPTPAGHIAADPWRPKWEGPSAIGSDWGSYKNIFGLLPATPSVIN